MQKELLHFKKQNISKDELTSVVGHYARREHMEQRDCHAARLTVGLRLACILQGRHQPHVSPYAAKVKAGAAEVGDVAIRGVFTYAIASRLGVDDCCLA